jgi:uncharacterized protein YuzE
MRVEYDRSVDAAYVLLQEIAAGQVARTYSCDPHEAGAEINLDFDSAGRLVGIEVLGASRHLPPALLQGAVPPSPRREP